MTKAVHWFRKGLRLHDNPALLEAAKNGTNGLYPIFCIDPHFYDQEKLASIRVKFLFEALEDLDQSLRGLGSRLIVLRGDPIKELFDFIHEHDVRFLSFEGDIEPYAKERDARVEEVAKKQKVDVSIHWTHTLFNPEVLLNKTGGKCPMQMKQITNLVVGQNIPPPKDAPTKLPKATGVENNKSSFALPTLEEIKYPEVEVQLPWTGGESHGLTRLSNFMKQSKRTALFEKPQTNPTMMVHEPDTTQLSPYVKFGCLSARKFWHEVQKVYDKYKGKHAQPPGSLHGQLIFREWFYLVAHTTPNYDKMKGNPIVYQMDWDHDPEMIKKWENAETGFPWIDALMTQLKTAGWMHHLGRHAVACFLTRGDLYQDWEEGARIFDKYLVDADWAVNHANWMWLSCSCFFYQFFRVYSPVSFPQKYDKEGTFVKKMLPVLKDMPAKYIYEPWKAPKEVQKKAGCIIGTDYPEPIVDHAKASQENKDRIKACYDARKAGKEPPTKRQKIK
eukprot:Clim_evm21s158 gene=Clim_evmTU21s158